MAHTKRDANILGALSLMVSSRMLADADAERLSPSAAAAIVALSGWLDGASIERLSDVLGLSHSGSVRLVDRLEADGLVARRPGADRRSVALGVTARGGRLAARLQMDRAEALEEVLAPLDRAQRAQLADLHAALLGAAIDSPATAARVCRLCDAEGCGHYSGECPVTNAADAVR